MLVNSRIYDKCIRRTVVIVNWSMFTHREKGGRVVFLVYPPLVENISKIPPPPEDFEKIRHFVPEIEEKRENFA